MTEKKKILYIVEAMGGGVFTYIVDLANELVNEFDMYIAYAVRPQTPVNYKEYFDKSVHLIEVKNFCREIRPIKEIKAVREVRKIAEEVKPDIIHLHSSKAGVIGRVAFDGRDVPLFYTPHGYSFLMSNYKPLKRWIFRMIETVCAKRKCTTISCSHGEHQETLKLTKIAAYVNNGINVAELQKIIDKTEVKPHPFTVFTLGRICNQKNPKLFNEIAEAMPDVRFVWIGDGELRDELSSPNIEITGWADRATAIAYAVNADVFLLTSLWEGLPISLLESMYMKKVCVVSDVIGNRDVIENDVNGYVCDRGSDFVEAIQEVHSALTEQANSEHNISTLTQRAYEDILNTYNTKVMAEQYAERYMKYMKLETTLKPVGGVQDELNYFVVPSTYRAIRSCINLSLATNLNNPEYRGASYVTTKAVA